MWASGGWGISVLQWTGVTDSGIPRARIRCTGLPITDFLKLCELFQLDFSEGFVSLLEIKRNVLKQGISFR